MSQSIAGRPRLWYAIIILAGLLIALLVFTDWLSILRGPAPETSEWYWPYFVRPIVRWWPAVLGCGGVLGILGWWLGRPAEARGANCLVIALLILLSMWLQIAFVYADRPEILPELVDRTLSVRNSGYFWTAANIDNMDDVLRTYPDRMPLFESEHARTHPPGLVVANYSTIAALRTLPPLAEKLAMPVWPARCTDLWLYGQPTAIPAGL